jgi:hypothetical protein
MSIRDELLELRARIDRLLEEVPAAPALAVVSTAQRYMKVPAYAKSRGLSARTIRDYCDLGMPHEGRTHNRRVLVAEADQWIREDGPRRARMRRKAS